MVNNSISSANGVIPGSMRITIETEMWNDFGKQTKNIISFGSMQNNVICENLKQQTLSFIHIHLGNFYAILGEHSIVE